MEHLAVAEVGVHDAEGAAEGFVREEHRRLVLVAEDPEALLDQFEAWRPPQAERWIDSRTA